MSIAGSENHEMLRSLPSVDEVVRQLTLSQALQETPRAAVIEAIRQAIDDCRQKIREGQAVPTTQLPELILQRTMQLLRERGGQRQRPVINATGILLHTNLGRAPLADHAVDRIRESAGYTNVELDLENGRRSERGAHVCDRLCLLTGAEAAVVVNNCAAATMLALNTLAAGREVIVSRGQLVEIGGGYRLPEVFSAAGTILREVGTTNRTYLKDYQSAVSDDTAAIIRVHRSNFCQSGFVTEPALAELVQLAQERSLPLIDDLGSGCVTDLSALGISEPMVQASVAAGAELTLFSGDKLLGGPQAGIIVGRSTWIQRMKRSPMMRALRADKLILAALEATVELHLSEQTRKKLPLLAMLFRSAEELRRDCEGLLHGLDVPESVSVSIESTVCEVGGGSVPGSALPGFALRVSGIPCDDFSRILRRQPVPVMARIQQGQVWIEMRTVMDHQRADLRHTLQEAIRQTVTKAES